jgi:hypothetical protein
MWVILWFVLLYVYVEVCIGISVMGGLNNISTYGGLNSDISIY